MEELKLFRIVTTVAVYGVYMLTGLCYAQWLRPFMSKRSTAYWTAGSYLLITVLLNLLPEQIADTPLKLVAVAFPLALMCLLERRNYKQKIFLCMVFVVLRWLAIGAFAEIGFFERDFIFSFELFRSSIPAVVAEFLVWEFLWMAGIVLLLYGAIRIVLKVYRRKKENMTLQELILLLAPVGAVLTVRPLIAEYYDLWGEGIRRGFIEENIPGNIYRLLFYALSFAAVLATVSFYQQLKSRQEQEQSILMLEQQIRDQKKHMEQVERLYADMRGMRHDLGNHIAALEGLIGQGCDREASEYMDALKNQFAEVQTAFKTGNPVTDLILSEYAQSFAEKGMTLEVRLVYPEHTDLNPFDMSIVLHNALQNILEADIAEEEAAKAVRVSSMRKGGIYMLDIRNPVREYVPLDEELGIPPSDKGAGHGYGLRNIRNVALRYQGEMDIRQEADAAGQLWFILNVMLQLREQETDI